MDNYYQMLVNLYFSGRLNDDLERKNLKRKIRILKLDEGQCKQMEADMIEKFDEMLDIFNDYHDGKGEFGLRELVTVQGFQNDLDITDQEFNLLTKAFKAKLQQSFESTRIQNLLAQDRPFDMEEHLTYLKENDYIPQFVLFKNISSRLVAGISKLDDLLYDFVCDNEEISDVLEERFIEAFAPLVNFIVDFSVKHHLHDDVYQYDEAFKHLGLPAIKGLSQEIEENYNQAAKAMVASNLMEQSSSDPGTEIFVGNLSVMLAFGAFRGLSARSKAHKMKKNIKKAGEIMLYEENLQLIENFHKEYLLLLQNQVQLYFQFMNTVLMEEKGLKQEYFIDDLSSFYAYSTKRIASSDPKYFSVELRKRLIQNPTSPVLLGHLFKMVERPEHRMKLLNAVMEIDRKDPELVGVVINELENSVEVKKTDFGLYQKWCDHALEYIADGEARATIQGFAEKRDFYGGTLTSLDEMMNAATSFVEDTQNWYQRFEPEELFKEKLTVSGLLLENNAVATYRLENTWVFFLLTQVFYLKDGQYYVYRYEKIESEAVSSQAILEDALNLEIEDDALKSSMIKILNYLRKLYLSDDLRILMKRLEIEDEAALEQALSAADKSWPTYVQQDQSVEDFLDDRWEDYEEKLEDDFSNYEQVFHKFKAEFEGVGITDEMLDDITVCTRENMYFHQLDVMAANKAINPEKIREIQNQLGLTADRDLVLGELERTFASFSYDADSNDALSAIFLLDRLVKVQRKVMNHIEICFGIDDRHLDMVEMSLDRETPDDEIPIVLLDTATFNSWKKGIVITHKHVYVEEQAIPIEEIDRVTLMDKKPVLELSNKIKTLDFRSNTDQLTLFLNAVVQILKMDFNQSGNDIYGQTFDVVMGVLARWNRSYYDALTDFNENRIISFGRRFNKRAEQGIQNLSLSDVVFFYDTSSRKTGDSGMMLTFDRVYVNLGNAPWSVSLENNFEVFRTKPDTLLIRSQGAEYTVTLGDETFCFLLFNYLHLFAADFRLQKNHGELLAASSIYDPTNDLVRQEPEEEKSDPGSAQEPDQAIGKKQAVNAILFEYSEKMKAVDVDRVSIGEMKKADSFDRFLSICSKKLGVNIDKSAVLGFYDDTTFLSGKKGFVVLESEIHAYMDNCKQTIRFADLVAAPEYEEFINSKIFLPMVEEKAELYCTGKDGAKVIYQMILSLYEHHLNK